jgi:hypothetical protein
MPADFWAALAPGQTLDFQVVELDAHGVATGYSLRRRILR